MHCFGIRCSGKTGRALCAVKVSQMKVERDSLKARVEELSKALAAAQCSAQVSEAHATAAQAAAEVRSQCF